MGIVGAAESHALLFGFGLEWIASVYTHHYSYVTINAHMVLFDTHHWDVFQVLISDTMAMGRFLDVVCYQLSVT